MLVPRGHPLHRTSMRPQRRRGFTLMEALMASAILFGVVVTVTTAITAGQQHAFEAHQRIAATLAAEDLMGRLTTETYANLATWDGYREEVGAMTNSEGDPLPDSFITIGREVGVTTSLKTIGGLGVRVRGRDVTVQAFDAEGRVICELIHFIPEPS